MPKAPCNMVCAAECHDKAGACPLNLLGPCDPDLGCADGAGEPMAARTDSTPVTAKDALFQFLLHDPLAAKALKELVKAVRKRAAK